MLVKIGNEMRDHYKWFLIKVKYYQFINVVNYFEQYFPKILVQFLAIYTIFLMIYTSKKINIYYQLYNCTTIKCQLKHEKNLFLQKILYYTMNFKDDGLLWIWFRFSSIYKRFDSCALIICLKISTQFINS